MKRLGKATLVFSTLLWTSWIGMCIYNGVYLPLALVRPCIYRYITDAIVGFWITWLVVSVLLFNIALFV